jgi:hypothetical protein
MATGSSSLLPAVGRVTQANARQKLSEQLAAVAAVFPQYEDSQPYSAERTKTDVNIEGLDLEGVARFQLSYWREPADRGITARLDHWLDELTANLKKISTKLPDVESYSVQVGFPLGVSVSVTFSARTGASTSPSTAPKA